MIYETADPAGRHIKRKEEGEKKGSLTFVKKQLKFAVLCYVS